MPKVRLSEAAGSDLDEIHEFGLDRFGNEVADAYQLSIDVVLTRLETFPLIGEERSEYGADIRCVVHRKHRILYQVGVDEIVIVRILHHSRDVPRHLAK